MKELFPIFQKHPDLVYLDNAATTQKPYCVIDAISEYYINTNANIDGLYSLSRETSATVNAVRNKIGAMLGVEAQQIIFVPSVTYAASIIALGLEYLIESGDQIVVTSQEHHSSILPWRSVAQRKEADLVVLPMRENGLLDTEYLDGLASHRIKFFICTHVSNVVGIENPIQQLYQKIKTVNPEAIMIVDGSQSVPHGKAKVMAEWSDLCFFSAHKMYGPTGIAVLSGKQAILEQIQPIIVGGKMALDVGLTEYSVRPLPLRLEAGTPNTADIAGLGAAVDFLQEYGELDQSDSLLHNLALRLNSYSHITILGGEAHRVGLLSFFSNKYNAYDIGMLLAQKSVAVRTGLHCAIPLHTALNLSEGTVRVSSAVYTTLNDIEVFMNALERTFELLD